MPNSRVLSAREDRFSELESSANVRKQSWKAAAGGSIGSVIEFYDFTLFVFLATIISARFFPSQEPSAAFLSTLAAVGVGYLVRPLGGLLIGWVADRRGRKFALILTFVLMITSTVCIGILPDYSAIGYWAPVILVLLRLMQGFSAGAEWSTAATFITEWAPEGRRGIFGSVAQMGITAGSLLGTLTVAALSTVLAPADLESWGWRIPFLVGGIVLLPVGVYLRQQVQETPAFKKVVKAPPAPTAKMLKQVLRLIGTMLGGIVCILLTTTFMPAYAERFLSISRATAGWSNTVCNFLVLVLTPFIGLLSDRIGRRPMFLGANLIFVVSSIPLFMWMTSAPGTTSLYSSQVVFAVATSLIYGATAATLVEMFPTRSRTMYMSLGYGLAVAMFGGFSGFASSWLTQRTGSPIAPAYLMIAASLVTVFTVWGNRETAFLTMAQIDAKD
jgi:MHS family proline/betaine transporter-like MFS transporter